jgi:hypothetical protein
VIVLLYFDWFGTVEELEEFEEEAAIVYAEEDGVEFKGRYAPDNRKFHFVYVYETDSYGRLLEVLMGPEMPPRDFKKLTHGTFEILRGPL